MPLTSFGSFVASAVPASRGVNAGRADYLAGLRFNDEQDAIYRERDFAELQRQTPMAVPGGAPGLTPPMPNGLRIAGRSGIALPMEQVASQAAPADPAVFNDFMGTVATQVNNPYALATIAAYGQRESSFAAQNAAGTWSDPSQSGQPGTSGGVLSWRNERLQALRQFAQQKGDNPMAPSAATQAEFFLSEDPMLVQRLNNAQSLEEANSIMANAWRFAGWDDPSPTSEASARLATAQSFYSQIAGMIPGAQEGVSTSAAALGRPAPVAPAAPARAPTVAGIIPPTPQPEVSMGSAGDLGAGFVEAPYAEADAAAQMATAPAARPAPAPTPAPIPVAATAPTPPKRKVPDAVKSILQKSPNAINFELQQAQRNAQYAREMAQRQYQQYVADRQNAMTTLQNARRVGDVNRSAQALQQINEIDQGIFRLDAELQATEQGATTQVRKLNAEMALQDLERRGDTRKMQELWSEQGGLPVAIQPRSDGKYTVYVASPTGDPVGTVVSYEDLASSFMEDLFGDQRSAAASSDAANVAQLLEAQLEIAKEESKQNAIGRNELRKIIAESKLNGYFEPKENSLTGALTIASKDGSHVIEIMPQGEALGPDGLAAPRVRVLPTAGLQLR